MARHIWVILAAGGVGLVVVGLARGEWSVVWRYATTLCTACIGLAAGAGH